MVKRIHLVYTDHEFKIMKKIKEELAKSRDQKISWEKAIYAGVIALKMEYL